MACYDISPYLCTYDSGGAGSLPGGGDPDYSVLDTWESDSDNDLSSTGITILDCYDSQNHVQNVVIAGATNTDTTHYRQIQSSSSCATPFAGKVDTGANFRSIVSYYDLNENYCRFLDLCFKLTITVGNNTQAVSTGYNGEGQKAINCVLHDCSNLNVSSVCNGMYLYGSRSALAYNCIAYGNEGSGFFLNTWVITGTPVVATVCCTSIDNGEYGVYSHYSGGAAIIFSCYAADNTTADFSEINLDAPSGWNASKDTTSDLGGTAGNNYKNSTDLTDAELDANYLPIAGQTLSWSGGAGDNAGRNQYNDLTASYDFYDFFKNDTGGEAVSKSDIRGIDRPTSDTADASWDVGAGQQSDTTSTSSTTSSSTTSTTSSSTTSTTSSSTTSTTISATTTTISATTTTISATTTTQPYQHLVFVMG